MRAIVWAALLGFSPLALGDDLAKYDAKITAEDRAHWAFQAIRRPDVPRVKDGSWCRNPIDRFVLATLEEKGWHPSPPPPRSSSSAASISISPACRRRSRNRTRSSATPRPRRSTASSTTCWPAPPTASAGRGTGSTWRGSPSRMGYERDATKPHAWRYRDWVIRSLNDDKPYDRFLVEQLAGDELPDAGTDDPRSRPASSGSAPGTTSPPTRPRTGSTSSTTSSRPRREVFLGLTLGCARCHDHKFEPLTSLDYTRMVAVFAPLRRPRNGRTELDLPAGSRPGRGRRRAGPEDRRPPAGHRRPPRLGRRGGRRRPRRDPSPRGRDPGPPRADARPPPRLFLQ